MDLLSLSGQLCWEPTPVHFPPTWDVTEGLGVTSSGLRHSGVIRYGAWLPGGSTLPEWSKSRNSSRPTGPSNPERCHSGS